MSLMKFGTYAIEKLKSLFDGKPIKKNDLVNTISEVNGILITSVVPSIKGARNLYSGLSTTPEQVKIFLDTFKRVGIYADSIDDALRDLENFCTNLIDVTNKLMVIASDDADEVITNRTLKPTTAYVIKVTNMTTSMVLFIPDLLLYNLDRTYDIEGMPKIRRVNIEDNLLNFKVNYLYLNDKNIITKVTDSKILPDIRLDLYQIQNTEKFDNSELLFELPTNGFVGNPIFHIRLYFVDRDLESLNDIELKTMLLRAKLENLKLQQSGKTNPKAEKLITATELEISKNEKKIKKLKS